MSHFRVVLSSSPALTSQPLVESVSSFLPNTSSMRSNGSRKTFRERRTATHVKCNRALAIINHKRNFFLSALPRMGVKNYAQ